MKDVFKDLSGMDRKKREKFFRMSRDLYFLEYKNSLPHPQ